MHLYSQASAVCMVQANGPLNVLAHIFQIVYGTYDLDTIV